LRSSANEGAIVGRVVVAGGVSQRARNVARREKRRKHWIGTVCWNDIEWFGFVWACVTGLPEYGHGKSVDML